MQFGTKYKPVLKQFYGLMRLPSSKVMEMPKNAERKYHEASQSVSVKHGRGCVMFGHVWNRLAHFH